MHLISPWLWRIPYFFVSIQTAEFMNEITKKEKEKNHFINPRPERPEELSEVSINIHTPLPPRRATEIPRGGGVQKEVISERVGIASRVFFRGLE